jgi:hypothetical protein
MNTHAGVDGGLADGSCSQNCEEASYTCGCSPASEGQGQMSMQAARAVNKLISFNNVGFLRPTSMSDTMLIVI